MYFIESTAIWGVVFVIYFVKADSNQTQLAQVGKEFALNCSESTGSDDTMWLFTGFNKVETTIPDKDPRLSQNINKNTLRFMSVQMTDAGIYKCTSFRSKMHDNGKSYLAEDKKVLVDLLVLEHKPICNWEQSTHNQSVVNITCTIKYGGTKVQHRIIWTYCDSQKQSFFPRPLFSKEPPANNIYALKSTMLWDVNSAAVCINISFNGIPKTSFDYTWHSNEILSRVIKTTAHMGLSTNANKAVSTNSPTALGSNNSGTDDADDDNFIIILVVAVGGFLCLLIFSFLGVFVARRSKFAVCENLGRRVEPDIMKHRDLPEALSIANYSMREMPEMEQQPPENELYINQEEMRHDSQPEFNISRASSHQSVPEYQNSIDEMLNQVKTCKKVGSDGTVYIELNGPKLTPTLPIRPRRLPAPPPEVMAHSNSMYALVDHKPRIPPPPPNDI